MIQRIQTVFLIICTIIYSLFFFIPLRSVNSDTGVKGLYISSPFNNDFSYTATFSVVSGFIMIGIAASVAAIFCYRQRYLQMRLCLVLMVISAICTLLLAFTQSVEHYGSAEIRSVPAIILLASTAGFALLAKIYIQKDIDLLKKADRIR